MYSFSCIITRSSNICLILLLVYFAVMVVRDFEDLKAKPSLSEFHSGWHFETRKNFVLSFVICPNFEIANAHLLSNGVYDFALCFFSLF